LSLDACHLKREYGGQLLCAIGNDVNDDMFPIMYAVADVVFCLPKYINNKITTRNSMNLCRRAILRVSNLKNCVGIIIKLFEIKYNLIKRCLI
jgi:hypothetical protein